VSHSFCATEPTVLPPLARIVRAAHGFLRQRARGPARRLREPVSVTLRRLIERAGGVRNGARLKAVIPGGISAKILRANEIDVAMDFNSLALREAWPVPAA